MKALAILLALALLGFGIQTVRLYRTEAAHDRYVKDQAVAQTKAIEKARAEEQALRKGVEDALKEANRRADAARVAADAARAERDSLHDDLSAARAQIASATRPALNDYATALSGLFDQCAASYQELARQAQGHASDVRTLMDAWPKNSR